MTVAVFIILALIVWALLSGSGRHAPGRTDKSAEADKAWQEARAKQGAEMTERRASVLNELRHGRLSQAQIAAMLESSGQFGFTAAELAELKAAGDSLNPKLRSPARAVCKVCGHPAMPGEDLCYSHHAK